MVEEGNLLSPLLSTDSGYASTRAGGGGLVAPPTGPCVPEINHSNLGVIDQMEGSHWDDLVGENSLVPSLAIIQSTPRALMMHSVNRVVVHHLSSEGLDVVLDLGLRGVEGKSSDEDCHLPSFGRPNLGDGEVTVELYWLVLHKSLEADPYFGPYSNSYEFL